VVLRSGVYADSVKLMQVSRTVSALPGVTGVIVAMATPLNLELAGNMGLAPNEPTTPEQLLIGVRAEDDDALAAAVAAVDAALAERERSTGTATAIPQRTIGAGLDELPSDGPALAIVSVPGQYAVATSPRRSAGWPRSTHSPPSTPTPPPSGYCSSPSPRRRRSRRPSRPPRPDSPCRCAPPSCRRRPPT